jgi:hypothetical protein
MTVKGVPHGPALAEGFGPPKVMKMVSIRYGLESGEWKRS